MKDKDAKYQLWKAFNLGEDEYRVAYGSYIQQKNRQMRKHKEDTYLEPEKVSKKKKKE